MHGLEQRRIYILYFNSICMEVFVVVEYFCPGSVYSIYV